MIISYKKHARGKTRGGLNSNIKNERMVFETSTTASCFNFSMNNFL